MDANANVISLSELLESSIDGDARFSEIPVDAAKLEFDTNGVTCDGQLFGIDQAGRNKLVQRVIEAVPSAGIRVVPATESDIPEILGLIRGLAEYENLQHQMTATKEGLRETLFSAQPAAEVLLAFVESHCAGFALFFPTFCSALGRRGLFLDNLFVKPEWRGKGIGDALLSRLAQIAAERQCARLEWMVLNWNHSAIGFYRAEGAALLDGWTKCRMTEDAIRRLCDAKGDSNEGMRGA